MIKKIIPISFAFLLVLEVSLLGGFWSGKIVKLSDPSTTSQVRGITKGTPSSAGATLNSPLRLLADKHSYEVATSTLATWQTGNPQDGPKLEYHPLKSYALAQIGGAPVPSDNPTSASAVNYRLVGDYVLGLAGEINQNARNAELKIENGRASSFIAHQYGQLLNRARTLNDLAAALTTGQNNVSLPVLQEVPQTTLGELNNLGINELIGEGESDFSGSSASRIHNIRVGASRYNGLIIQPDTEFSFNQYLGPVTGEAGFLPELVIKAEGTIPEYGGGLCQVSTTAFRAALFSGQDITQRKNHSYAVKYYKWINDDFPPIEGLDATIYPGVVDMKFINNTKGAILIWTRIEGNKLYFDFYGTPDDRQVVIEGPRTYDRKASGALKATVTQKVVLNGITHEQEFLSNYVSPNIFPRTYELQPKTNEDNGDPPETQEQPNTNQST